MSPFIIVRNLFFLLIAGVGVADYFLEVHWMWYFFPVLLFLDLITIGAAVMKYNFFVKAFTAPSVSTNEIAITFDDGPSAHTAAVLDVLKKHGCKASFFCIGKNMESHPEIARRIHREGHFIGNHSWSHSPAFSFFGKKKISGEIKKTNSLIKAITGRENYYFRPPYGVTNPPIAKAVKITGMKVIGWNIRSFDTTTAKPEKVVDRVISSLQPGSVVLLHDHLKNAAEVLEIILQFAKKKQYKCVCVDRIFKFEDYE